MLSSLIIYPIALMMFWTELKLSSWKLYLSKRLKKEFSSERPISSFWSNWRQFSNRRKMKGSPSMGSCILRRRRLLGNQWRSLSCIMKIILGVLSTFSKWWKSMIAKTSSSPPLLVCMAIRIIARKLMSFTLLAPMDNRKWLWKCFWLPSGEHILTGGSYLSDISIPVVAMNQDFSGMSQSATLITYSPLFRKLWWARERN